MRVRVVATAVAKAAVVRVVTPVPGLYGPIGAIVRAKVSVVRVK